MPAWSRGRTLSSRARGDTTELHGTLQRLLDGSRTCGNLRDCELLCFCWYYANRKNEGSSLGQEEIQVLIVSECGLEPRPSECVRLPCSSD